MHKAIFSCKFQRNVTHGNFFLQTMLHNVINVVCYVGNVELEIEIQKSWCTADVRNTTSNGLE